MSEHVCPYPEPILAALAPHLTRMALQAGLVVHDPFAGSGERLGALCTELGLAFTGTEIEREFIVDPGVMHGDSTEQRTYPKDPFLVCTSPVYPNGMTDHFKAANPEGRFTYRAALARIRKGVDRPLHENNMARYGNRYRRSAKVEAEHWRIANDCLRWWPEWVILNLKDVTTEHYEVHVVETWMKMLHYTHGYAIRGMESVPSPGVGYGGNPHRAESEYIIIAHNPSRA